MIPVSDNNTVLTKLIAEIWESGDNIEKKSVGARNARTESSDSVVSDFKQT